MRESRRLISLVTASHREDAQVNRVVVSVSLSPGSKCAVLTRDNDADLASSSIIRRIRGPWVVDLHAGHREQWQRGEIRFLTQ